jgi:hemolysin D
MSRPVRRLPDATQTITVQVRRRPAVSVAMPLAVLEFESPSAAIIARPLPPMSRAISLFVFLLVVSVLTATALMRIDKIVSAKGRVTTDAPNIVIQPFDQTIVESIDVKEGSIVRKGQVLARLNGTFAAADQTTMKDQVALLSARAARLQAEADGVEYVPESANPHGILQASLFGQRRSEYEYTLQAYDKRSGQLETQIAGDRARAVSLRGRLGIASDIERIRSKLQAQQADSKYNTLVATDTRLGFAASLSDAESDAAQAERSLGAERAERKTFIERWKGQVSVELAEVRSKLVDAQQQYAKTNLHNQLVVLKAPRDAVVLSVAKISVGSVVTSAETLMQLVPIDSQLWVEADISGIDSGYITAGDSVRIKFDTLPFLRYGTARGVVRTISADSFSPEMRPSEGGSVLPGRPSTLYYRANISLREFMLHDTPAGFRPMPGMPVTADVKVGERSVLGYFIDRILPISHDALREP